jgi:hypothetical protein
MFPKIMEYFGLPSFTNYDFSYKIVFIFMGYLNLLAIVATLFL